jgi:hypothetical protein
MCSACSGDYEYDDTEETVDRSQGNWIPACNGTETEFKTRSGFRLLYVYQPSTGNHAYLNLDTDMILSTDEAMRALGVF